MKTAIIMFIIALGLSALAGPFVWGEMPQYSVKGGVAGIEPLPEPEVQGIRRGESLIPDMQVVDGYRTVRYMTKVGDSQSEGNTDFPWPQME